MSAFNRQYPNLFGLEDEEDGQEDDTGGEDEDDESGGGDSPAKRFAKKWGWVSSVDTVSERMRKSWDEVYLMPVTEFLNILSYARDKADTEKAMMEEYKRKIRAKRH